MSAIPPESVETGERLKPSKRADNGSRLIYSNAQKTDDWQIPKAVHSAIFEIGGDAHYRRFEQLMEAASH